MTIRTKYTKLEWQIVQVLTAAGEPLTTRQLARQIYPVPKTTAGVQATAAALFLRGAISKAKSRDGLELTWCKL